MLISGWHKSFSAVNCQTLHVLVEEASGTCYLASIHEVLRPGTRYEPLQWENRKRSLGWRSQLSRVRVPGPRLTADPGAVSWLRLQEGQPSGLTEPSR